MRCFMRRCKRRQAGRLELFNLRPPNKLGKVASLPPWSRGGVLIFSLLFSKLDYTNKSQHLGFKTR